MVNAESILVSLINQSSLPEEAYTEVPPSRPDAFYTVERVGGGETNYVDHPLIIVQCWNTTRWTASEMARIFAETAKTFESHPNVGMVEIQTVNNNPDDKQARYEVLLSMTTVG